eukprot:Hpha_TRINITY_DN22312_c0_g1::TRINITY_DN22312_c0_g1_i1::g.177748::m.177748
MDSPSVEFTPMSEDQQREEGKLTSNNAPAVRKESVALDIPRGGKMPAAEDLSKLPEGLQDELRTLAGRRIGKLLAPILKLRRGVTMPSGDAAEPPPLGNESMTSPPTTTLAGLATNTLFTRVGLNQWKEKGKKGEIRRALQSCTHLGDFTEAALNKMLEKGRHVRSAPGEVIYSDGDNCSGIWALVAGTVCFQFRQRAGVASALEHMPQYSGNRAAPFVFGVEETMCDTPQVVGIQALTASMLVNIPRQEFLKEVSNLPKDSQQMLNDLGHNLRERAMSKLSPMTVELMQQFYVFECLTAEQLESIRVKLVPRCVQPGEVLCLANDTASEMYLVRRGTVELLQPGMREHKIHIQGPACVGEMALVYGERRACTLRASSTMDAWVLQYHTVAPLLQEPKVREKTQAAGDRQRVRWMQQMKTRWEA